MTLIRFLTEIEIISRRAGYKVTVIDASDHDWWKGKCLGKIGFFPSKYVAKLAPNERPLQVTHNLQISETEDGLNKLLRDQVKLLFKFSQFEKCLTYKLSDCDTNWRGKKWNGDRTQRWQQTRIVPFSIFARSLTRVKCIQLVCGSICVCVCMCYIPTWQT